MFFFLSSFSGGWLCFKSPFLVHLSCRKTFPSSFSEQSMVYVRNSHWFLWNDWLWKHRVCRNRKRRQRWHVYTFSQTSSTHIFFRKCKIFLFKSQSGLICVVRQSNEKWTCIALTQILLLPFCAPHISASVLFLFQNTLLILH